MLFYFTAVNTDVCIRVATMVSVVMLRASLMAESFRVMVNRLSPFLHAVRHTKNAATRLHVRQ
ncbi:MAG: hypothetical protein RR329_06975 [Mucinivorans sp.]